MTDAYNGDSDHPEQEQDIHAEPVHEQPSDHEFAEAEASEHTEEHGEEQAVTEAPRRRSAGLPIAAAIVGIALLGAAAWWQFGRGGVTPDAPVFVPPAPVAADARPAAAPAPAPPAAPTTDAAPPVSVPAPVVPAVAPVASPVVNNIAAPAPVVPAPFAPVAPIPVTPAPLAKNEGSVTPAAAPGAPAPVTPATQVQVATPTPPSDEDQRIEELTARVEDLQKALDSANSRLSQMSNMVAASVHPVGEGVSIVAKPTTLSVKPHPHHHHATPVKKPVHKPAVETHTLPETPPAAATHWVLRAAVPGQAWLSLDATSTDLKQVKVGDSVPGIGKVTAITHMGDNWIVQGSAGTIK